MSARVISGLRVLVTRPEHQATPLCARLQAAGAIVQPFPTLAITPIDPDASDQAALRQRLLNLDLYQHIILVSTNAAHQLLNAVDHYWPQPPVGIHWWAVGSATAGVLERAGMTVEAACGCMNSEELLAHPDLQNPVATKVLIVRGQGGRPLLADTLISRGAEVDYAELYRREQPTYTADEIKSRIYDFSPSAILVSSGEALDNLLLLAPALNRSLPSLVAPSARVASNARQHGFERVVTAANATDDAMFAAVVAAFSGNE